jgi:hypothetical protein
MAKRKDNSQINNLIPEKSGIDPISMCADGMRHIVRKLSMRATTLFQISSQLEVCTQSFGAPKLRESQPWRFCHLDVGPMERCKVYYKGEGGGFPQVRAVVSLVCLSCSWFILTPKVL